MADSNVEVWGVNFLELTVVKRAIEDLSRANPCVVTWTGHGKSSGDKLIISGITQADWAAALNGTHICTVIDADTVSVPVDTSAIALAYDPGTDPGKYHWDKWLCSKRIRPKNLEFKPSASNDRLLLRQYMAAAAPKPAICDLLCATAATAHRPYYGKYQFQPELTFSDSVISDVEAFRLMIEYDLEQEV